MKVFICDRCGAKIDPQHSGSVISIGKIDDLNKHENFDLCVSCAYKIKKFLKLEADIKSEVEE